MLCLDCRHDGAKWKAAFTPGPRWRCSFENREEEDNSRQKEASTGTGAKCNVCVRHSDETHLVGAGGLRGSHETGKRGRAGLCQAFYLRSGDGSLKVSEWG